jgi:hypothetical protein
MLLIRQTVGTDLRALPGGMYEFFGAAKVVTKPRRIGRIALTTAPLIATMPKRLRRNRQFLRILTRE